VEVVDLQPVEGEGREERKKVVRKVGKVVRELRGSVGREGEKGRVKPLDSDIAVKELRLK